MVAVRRAAKRKTGKGAMTDREADLLALGVSLASEPQACGPTAAAPTYITPVFPSLSGFGEFTPVTIRSGTVQTKNADLERNRPRD